MVLDSVSDSPLSAGLRADSRVQRSAEELVTSKIYTHTDIVPAHG